MIAGGRTEGACFDHNQDPFENLSILISENKDLSQWCNHRCMTKSDEICEVTMDETFPQHKNNNLWSHTLPILTFLHDTMIMRMMMIMLTCLVGQEIKIQEDECQMKHC